jgi:hypothetical protein
VAHSYNFSYLGGEDWEDQGKKLARCHLHQPPIMVAHTCNPSDTGNLNSMIKVQAILGKKPRPYLKK